MHINEMAEAYHQQMLEGDHAPYYQGHGVGASVITNHKLGWIDEPLAEGHTKWQGMPVVPYLTAGNNVVALRVQPFESEKAGRYDLGYIEHVFPLTHPRWRLYNVGNAMPGLRTSTVHLVDRVLDVLVRRTAGERAVAVPGYQNFHPWWAELFLHSEVVVHHDGKRPKAVQAMTEEFRQRRITFTEEVHREAQGTRVEEA